MNDDLWAEANRLADQHHALSERHRASHELRQAELQRAQVVYRAAVQAEDDAWDQRHTGTMTDAERSKIFDAMTAAGRACGDIESRNLRLSAQEVAQLCALGVLHRDAQDAAFAADAGTPPPATGQCPCIGCQSGRPYDCDRLPAGDDPRFILSVN